MSIESIVSFAVNWQPCVGCKISAGLCDIGGRFMDTQARTVLFKCQSFNLIHWIKFHCLWIIYLWLQLMTVWLSWSKFVLKAFEFQLDHLRHLCHLRHLYQNWFENKSCLMQNNIMLNRPTQWTTTNGNRLSYKPMSSASFAVQYLPSEWRASVSKWPRTAQQVAWSHMWGKCNWAVGSCIILFQECLKFWR